MTEPIDPYLWDPARPPDADVARLEALLAPLASRPPATRATRRWLALAAACALLALPGVLLLTRTRANGWRIELAHGGATVNGAPAESLLRPGEVLETDARSSAALRMPGVGTVIVDPGSRLRVKRVADDEQRLVLENGRIVATITAPPRLFFVDTPSAEAVDLGCVYSLRTDAAGRGLLDVAVGFVALQRDGREVVVPAGASCPLSPTGPGIPRFNDAPAGLLALLEALDSESAVADPELGAGLGAGLEAARVKDTLSLLHMIPLLDGAARLDVIVRADALVPMPAGDRAGIEAADADALLSWRLEMQRAW